MPQVKSFKEIGVAKHHLKSIADEIDVNVIEDIRNTASKIITITNLLSLVEDKDIENKQSFIDILNTELEEANKKAEILSDSEDRITTYSVRGLTPIEKSFLSNMLPLEKMPTPPKKKKEILTLDNRRSINPEQIEDSFYYDENDPTYKQEQIIWTRLLNDYGLTASIYKLVCCVKGFDLTDEEIQESLSEAPKGKQNRKLYQDGKEDKQDYIDRLNQIAKIILPVMDTKHFDFLIQEIDDLTGIQPVNINFT